MSQEKYDEDNSLKEQMTSELRINNSKQNQSKDYRSIFLIIIIAVNFVAISLLLKKINLKQVSEENLQQKQMQTVQAQCDDSPPADKSYYILNDSLIGRSDLNYSKLSIKNHIDYHTVIQISSPDKFTHYALLSAHPKSAASISLPQGSYDIELKIGRVWCNRQIGFSDGKIVVVDNKLHMENGVNNEIIIEPKGAEIGNINLVLNKYNQVTQNTESQNRGYEKSININIAINGNYYIDGTINNHKTTFMVDTGASFTSIPKELANSLGITNCRVQSFETANGLITGCVGIISELTFGIFKINNVEVAILPNLSNSLLGMNVLNNIKMETVAGVMKLSMN